MHYYRLVRGGSTRLVARDGDDAFDLTSATPDLNSFRALARTAAVVDQPVDAVARTRLDDADQLEAAVVDEAAATPLVPDEVWAAGVTYEISEAAREAESELPEIYLDVYDADRPELFFKATADRTVGPGEPIGVRGDATWNVPEPELSVVLHRGEVVGYTVGNDVSSRDIEGANPLYLPQAKVYDRCCALGPCVAAAETVADPHDLEMTMTVDRADEPIYEGRTSTAEMVRTCEELVSYLTRHNHVPELGVLLTGTSLVPPDDFTLRPDDRVVITIEGIGTLENPVVEV